MSDLSKNNEIGKNSGAINPEGEIRDAGNNAKENVPEPPGLTGNTDFAEKQLEEQYCGCDEIEFFRSEQLDAFAEQLAELKDAIEKVSSRQNKPFEELKSYFETVAGCQETTSRHANEYLQRNELYPAVEAVDLLCRHIEEIAQHESLINESSCPLMASLAERISQLSKIAAEKHQLLGLVKIEPPEMEDLDPHKHKIKNAVDTADPDRHKKIKETLIPGLMYKDKVLRQALVCVYRYKKSDQNSSC